MAKLPEQKQYCGANKANGFPCKMPAGYRTPHLGWGRCLHHGGCTTSGRKAASTEQGRSLIAFYGSPIDTNPIDALLDEVRRTAGHVAWSGQKIAQWRETVTEEGVMPLGLREMVTLYQTERKHLVFVSKAALDAGISERLVRIAEHQGMRLADSIEQILLALNLTPEQRELIPLVVPPILRNLSGPILIEGEVVQ